MTVVLVGVIAVTLIAYGLIVLEERINARH
jgi:Flp pilus assembly pilin Flp